MPIVEETTENPKIHKSDKRVSFAPNLIDPREEENFQEEDLQPNSSNSNNNALVVPVTGVADGPDSPSSMDIVSTVDDGTGRRFKIPFQENRLRFDQTYPEGLNLRISQNEFEIVLEQIHRELVKPLDKSQSSVKKWSALVAGTAPIGVGFVLSAFLARRVGRHQKALKTFWISLRNHLKALNRDTYYARGIEWRIERDLDKMNERDAYNKLHCFRMEIVFRKPITLRSSREIAMRSVVESDRRSSALRESILNPSSEPRSSRFSQDHLNDPELFALLSIVPGGEEYNYQHPVVEDDGVGIGAVAAAGVAAGVGAGLLASRYVTDTIEEADEEAEESSPLFVPDPMAAAAATVTETETETETQNDYEKEDLEDLFVKVDEPSEVKEARVSSIYEPPSPNPAETVFSIAPEDENVVPEVKTPEKSEARKLTFAELLSASLENQDDSGVNRGAVVAGAAAAGVAGAVGLAALVSKDEKQYEVVEKEDLTTENIPIAQVSETPKPSEPMATVPAPGPMRMTYAEMLRASLEEEKAQDSQEVKKENKENAEKEDQEDQEDIEHKEDTEEEKDTEIATGVAAAGAIGLTAAMAAASLRRSPSPPTTPETSQTSREEAFAKRQRKKFSREPTLATQLYDIPESPKLAADEDPTGDAFTYLNEAEGEDDLIEDLLGTSIVAPKGKPSRIESGFKPKPVVTTHFEDVGDTPFAAYPMADPFAALYETDQVAPLDPPTESERKSEFAEVDGETEYVRRKKWRVAPENASKLSRVQTLTETIHPSSRRSSYLPLTKTTSIPKSFDFK